MLLGAHDRTIPEPNQVIVNVPRSNIIRHPDYDRNTLTNDLCILLFPNPVTLTKFIQVIPLPMNNELEHNIYDDYPSSLAGWGVTEEWIASPVLRYIRHKIMPNEECALNWKNLVTSHHICSRTIEGRSGCNGDSGGSLMVQLNGQTMQVGIVSFGSLDCTVILYVFGILNKFSNFYFSE